MYIFFKNAYSTCTVHVPGLTVLSVHTCHVYTSYYYIYLLSNDRTGECTEGTHDMKLHMHVLHIMHTCYKVL